VGDEVAADAPAGRHQAIHVTRHERPQGDVVGLRDDAGIALMSLRSSL
jgi:hypothetical protein